MPTNVTPKVEPLVIPITSGYSPWIDVRGYRVVAIETPASWTAANITVKARAESRSAGGVVYDDNPDTDGTQIVIAAAASRYIRCDRELFLGAQALAFAADGQAAARTILVVLMPESSDRDR